jgi:hypothetical protein
MTSTQFYRDPMPPEAAAEEIVKGAGKKYDPKLVEAFRKALPVMKKVRETYSDKLGDLINLDFAPKAAPAAPAPAAAPVAAPAAAPAASRPKVDVAALARAAAAAKASAKK